MRWRDDRGRGFSIVEMMMVVVIISVIAAIAVPTFSGPQSTDEVVRASEEIQRAFELARARAVRKNAAMRISFHADLTSGDARATVRVDESPDSTCAGFDRIADAAHPLSDPAEAAIDGDCASWRDTERHRCAVYEARVNGAYARGAYRERNVGIRTVTVAGAAMRDFVACITRRGRLFLRSGTDWVRVAGDIRIVLDRYEDAGMSNPVGVEKELRIPQGGVVGAFR